MLHFPACIRYIHQNKPVLVEDGHADDSSGKEENGKKSDLLKVSIPPKIGGGLSNNAYFINVKSSEDVQAQARKSRSQN